MRSGPEHGGPVRNRGLARAGAPPSSSHWERLREAGELDPALVRVRDSDMPRSRSTDRNVWAAAAEEARPETSLRASMRPWSRHPCHIPGWREPSARRHLDPSSSEIGRDLLFLASRVPAHPGCRDMRSPPGRAAARSWPERRGLPEYTGRSTLCCTCSWRHLLPKRCVPG